jgi:hypothetical protein
VWHKSIQGIWQILMRLSVCKCMMALLQYDCYMVKQETAAYRLHRCASTVQIVTWHIVEALGKLYVSKGHTK